MPAVEEYCGESLARCRELGRPWGIGYSLNNLGLAAAQQGDLARADVLTREGLDIFRTHWMRGGLLELIISSGLLAGELGDYAKAKGILHEALTVGWPAGPYWKVATALEELARLMVAEADPETALRLLSATQSGAVEWKRPSRPAGGPASRLRQRRVAPRSVVRPSPGPEQKAASSCLTKRWRWLSAVPVPSDHFKFVGLYAA